jgi:hypothetical protein
MAAQVTIPHRAARVTNRVPSTSRSRSTLVPAL